MSEIRLLVTLGIKPLWPILKRIGKRILQSHSHQRPLGDVVNHVFDR